MRTLMHKQFVSNAFKQSDLFLHCWDPDKMRVIGSRLGCRITLFDWGIYFTKWNEHCLSSFAFTDKICAASDSGKKVSTAHEMRWQIPASGSVENADGIACKS